MEALVVFIIFMVAAAAVVWIGDQIAPDTRFRFIFQIVAAVIALIGVIRLIDTVI